MGRPNLAALILWSACLPACWSAAAETLSPAERILGEAVAVLRINAPHWLDKEAGRFAAALGQDPGPLRAFMARSLFRSHSLQGLDLRRPALLAWRPGLAPLVAILPITSRRAFLDQFGVADDAPFIRVGEREGTVVFTQNNNDGLCEYRLKVCDNNIACLARTPKECEDLSKMVLPHVGTEAPLVFTAKGSWVSDLSAGFRTSGTLGLPGVSATMPIAPALALWQGLVGQVTEVGLELRPDSADGMHMGFRLKAVPDSLLAVWISNQRNQPNRLLPLVRSPATMVSIAGQVAWQGQGESFGSAIAGLIKPQAGKAWSDTVDEAWTALWTLSDRNGPFAAAFDLTIDPQRAAAANPKAQPSAAEVAPAANPFQAIGMEWRSLVEQRRAAEVIAHTNTVTSALAGTPGEPLTVVGAQGFRWTSTQGLAMAMVGTDRHVVQVQGNLRPVDQAIAELVQKSQGNAVPDPGTAIVLGAFDASPLARAIAIILQKPADTVIQPAVLTAALRTAGSGELLLDLGLPHMRLASMVRDSGLVTVEGPGKK